MFPTAHKQCLAKLFVLLLTVCFSLIALGCGANANNATESNDSGLVTVVEPIAMETPLSILVPSEAYNGQPFLVKAVSSNLEQVVISWAGKNLTIIPVKNADGLFEAMALLPVSLESKEEIRILNLKITDNGKTLNENMQIQVLKKKYPEQQLTVDPKFVQLSKADLERSQTERTITNAIIASCSPVQHWKLPFERPVPGSVSSLFGLARVFNGEPRSAHKGLDLRGAEGTPIKACADGTVVLAADHFFPGNVIYLDHGLGVFSIYCHMSEFAVQEGDFVKAGDVLGKVGSTGRVTGPHLHLSVTVLGTSVDPEILLDMQPDQTTTDTPVQTGNNTAVTQ